MKANSRLESLIDLDKNIWAYYSLMRITPIVNNNFLLLIMTIPLRDKLLQMNLYNVNTLPALHPELKFQFFLF